MTGRFLLDTNIVIALLAGDPEVKGHLSSDVKVFVPSIALGELYYGAYKSAATKGNVERIEDFARHSSVLACDDGTAQHYGRIKNFLRSKGRPIPENDIWIAAIAEQYRLTLVTRDDHFSGVKDILIEAW